MDRSPPATRLLPSARSHRSLQVTRRSFLRCHRGETHSLLRGTPEKGRRIQLKTCQWRNLTRSQGYLVVNQRSATRAREGMERKNGQEEGQPCKGRQRQCFLDFLDCWYLPSYFRCFPHYQPSACQGNSRFLPLVSQNLTFPLGAHPVCRTFL